MSIDGKVRVVWTYHCRSDRVVDVDSGELDCYLKLRWRFVSIMNVKKAVIRWESEGDPVLPNTYDSLFDVISRPEVAGKQ